MLLIDHMYHVSDTCQYMRGAISLLVLVLSENVRHAVDLARSHNLLQKDDHNEVSITVDLSQCLMAA